MYRLINLKIVAGKCVWYLQDYHSRVFSLTTKLPFQDYFFATEDQVELIKLHYPRDEKNKKNLFSFAIQSELYEFERFEYRDERVWKVRLPHPYMKYDIRSEIEKNYNELVFEADISIVDLILKDLRIYEGVEFANGKVKPCKLPDDFPPLKQIIIDFETDDRIEILRKSEKYTESFAKPDVARIISMSALDPQTEQVTHFCDSDEKKLLMEIKEFLKPYQIIRAWSGRKFDFIMFKRWKFVDIPFNIDKYILIDDMIIHEMMNRKESFYVSLDQAGLRYLDERKIKHKWGFYEAFLHHRKELEEYNNRDVELMHKLEEKFGFTNIIINLGYKENVGVLPQHILYSRKPSIQAVMRASLNHYNKRIIWKSKSDIPALDKFEGAFIPTPIAGRHPNVIGIDLISLYNNIIQTLNISPEQFYNNESVKGILKDFPPSDPLPDRYYSYDRYPHEGIMPRVLRIFEEDRNYYKELRNESIGEQYKIYESVQQGLKIVLLSIYGGLGARGSTVSKYAGGHISGAKSFYHWECASDVTALGREILKLTIRVTEEMGYKVIYGDTDSIYFTLGELPLQIEQVKEIIENVVATVNKEAQTILDKYNIPQERRKIKMEAQGWYHPFVLFDKKKHYFARELYNAENKRLHSIDHIEVYAKGVKMAKTSEPEFIKKFQESVYKMALTYRSFGEVMAKIKDEKYLFDIGRYDETLVFETKIKAYLSEASDSIAVRLAQDLKAKGKYQEKTSVFYVISHVGIDGKAVGMIEGSPIQRSGRDYVWNQRIKPWIDELLDFVYPSQTNFDGELVAGANRKRRKQKKEKKVMKIKNLDEFF